MYSCHLFLIAILNNRKYNTKRENEYLLLCSKIYIQLTNCGQIWTNKMLGYLNKLLPFGEDKIKDSEMEARFLSIDHAWWI